jgi:Family of unknown function (DUF5999)
MWEAVISATLIVMCTHRPQCPAIDEPNAHNACVVVHHAELGWSMLCNGAIVLDVADQAQPQQQQQQRRTPRRTTRATIRARRERQQPIAA